MGEDLSWPKYGWKLVLVTFLMIIAMTTAGSILIVRIGIDDNLPLHSIILAIAGQVPYCFIPTFFLSNMIFFILTWIETFGHRCTKISPLNAISHTEKCLLFYGTLQKGLGISYQLLIIYFTLIFILRIYILSAIYF